MRAKKNAGPAWRMNYRPWEVAPLEKTRWEQFVEGLGLTEDEAVRVAASRQGACSLAIRQWVKAHVHYCFIPEGLLEALGILVREEELPALTVAAMYRGGPKPRYGESPG